MTCSGTRRQGGQRQYAELNQAYEDESSSDSEMPSLRNSSSSSNSFENVNGLDSGSESLVSSSSISNRSDSASLLQLLQMDNFESEKRKKLSEKKNVTFNTDIDALHAEYIDQEIQRGTVCRGFDSKDEGTSKLSKTTRRACFILLSERLKNLKLKDVPEPRDTVYERRGDNETKELRDRLVTEGIYVGKMFSEVMRIDPDYHERLRQLYQDTPMCMIKKQDYVFLMFAKLWLQYWQISVSGPASADRNNNSEHVEKPTVNLLE